MGDAEQGGCGREKHVQDSKAKTEMVKLQGS